MNDQELAAEARRVAPELPGRPSTVTLKLAGELLKQMADRLDEHKAALELHQPITRRPGWSFTCSYDNHRWPCPEVATIVRTSADRLGGRAPEVLVVAWCKGCEHGTTSVPCPRCGGPACAGCGRCPPCDGDLPDEEE